MLLKGAITALVTPFTHDGQLDLDGLAHNIRFQIASGINGLVALGTTGETPTLTDEEQLAVMKVAIREAKNKVPVLVGSGTYCTATAIKKTAEAQRQGADGALMITPYYNKPSQEGIYRHFKAITDAVDLPIVVYNNPKRTGCNIEPDTLRRLAEIPTIVGYKDCPGSNGQITESLLGTQQRHDFSYFTGDDADTLITMALGGRGIISVIGNLVPREMVELTQAMATGNLTEARRIHQFLWPLMVNAFIETNPAPIKLAMSHVGMPAGPCRLPLCELQSHNRAKLIKTIESLILTDANAPG